MIICSHQGQPFFYNHAGNPSQSKNTVDSANDSIIRSMHSSYGEESKAKFQNKDSPCVGKPRRVSARLAQMKK